MELTSIGKRIKQRREELQMTQDELAKLLGYQSRSSINKIELGRQNLTQSKIQAISNVLKTTPSYIMGWDSPSSLKQERTSRLVLHYISLLNENGQDEAVKRIAELAEISKYKTGS